MGEVTPHRLVATKLLTGVDIVGWLKVEHGAEPGIMQVRALSLIHI